MIQVTRIADRSVLVGATISAILGIAWSIWAASGLPKIPKIVVAAIGVVLGLVILIPIIQARRSATATPNPPSIFSSWSYRILVILKVAAVVVGSIVLSRTGHTQYISPLVAFVVGVHFLGFGQFFWRGYYVLSVAVIAAAVAGTIVGLTGQSSGAITATTGIIAAISLFAAAARVL